MSYKAVLGILDRILAWVQVLLKGGVCGAKWGSTGRVVCTLGILKRTAVVGSSLAPDVVISPQRLYLWPFWNATQLLVPVLTRS
ncbi:hypothetical protein BOTBODRAFT_34307 [Botryobasidium botryosum FD-172 SS1]|uniref:Secreted protein n=1 Tax=Botryobasidium botryosum (strain FD-172 SS1) TaxID=930990 RepID=A0A067MLV9_BOTB1|nr:hypothetical protein BOTBODRAFT_34307 [Botryobasidium botryosum FD-172 SS1]